MSKAAEKLVQGARSSGASGARVYRGVDGSSRRWGTVSAPAASVIALLAALGSADVSAIAMVGTDDPTTESSFNSGDNWPGGAQPVAGNDYETGANRINTPLDNNDYTFAGDQLTVNGGLFAFKGGGVITVNSVGGSGGLVLNNGTVSVGFNGRATLDGLITLQGTNDFNAVAGARGINVESQITGSGGLTLQSSFQTAGEIVLIDPNNDYSGSTELITTNNNEVRLRAGGAGTLSPNSDIIVNSGNTVELDGFNNTIAGLAGDGTVENASGTDAELTVQGGTNNDFTGTIQDGAGAGTLSVTKAGTATQQFSSANTYTGGTSIEGGTLTITDNDALGTGDVSISGGTLELDPATIFNNLTLVGKSDLTSHLLASDPGSAVNGNVALVDGANATDNFNISAASGGSLSINGATTDTGSNDDSLNFLGDGDIEVAGQITLDDGTDAITKDGNGTLTLSGGASADSVSVDGGQLTLESTLTTTGDVSVASGAVLQQLGGSFIDATAQSGTFNVDGTIDVNGEDASISVLSGTDSGAAVDNTGIGAATLTLGNDDGNDGTYAGSITDTGGVLSVEKTGGNSQSVGDIDIGGSVDVTGGSLGADSVTSAGDVTANGGDVAITNDASSLGNVTVDGGSSVGIGGNLGSGGNVTVTDGSFDVGGDATVGGLSVASGSTADFNSSTGTSSTLDSLDNAGTVTAGASLSVTNAASNSGTLDVATDLSAGGNVINSGTATIGGDLSAADLSNSGSLDVDGNASADSATLTDGTADFAGAVSLTGTAPTLSVQGGTNTVQGSLTSDDIAISGGSLALRGSNSVGTVDITGGEIIVENSAALGGSGETDVQASGGQVSLGSTTSGDLSVAEVFNLYGRTDTGVHLENVANDNTITQVNLVDTAATDETYTITSEGGTLTINDVDATGLTAGDNTTLRLGGDSTDGTNAVTMDGVGAVDNLTKVGDSTWTANNLRSTGGTISSQGGILTLGSGANLSGNMVYEVLNDAELDVDSLGSLDLNSGDQAKGNGLIDGDIVAASSSSISAGDFGTVGDLEVSGLLDLEGLLQVDVSGAMIDSLTIGGNFDITAGSLDIVGTLNQNVYIFATYGSLTGSSFASINPDPLDGYSIDYAYGENDNQIALVRDTPIPTPAPLALIGLGALVWGGHRHLRRRAWASL
ncbi:autotransporter-associated beta strand repeat-containing protein [uncultured Thiohalocapsa sp.]|uniref:beta strand repeat-containing protein n=1 Tax=uncultured Thiohalocapsa sp. TaxID=768990 RepID=UPI0025EAD2D1|nr:autotransporter-associated beta strand repeat-containing protein [uncultured Thiohalocapsa sp.]